MKKIPDHATKVFEGVIFDVYHWEQQMFDGSFATFEALKRQGSVTVLAVADNTILINKEEQPGREPFYALPGGRIDRGENPDDAAKRELLEETGYVAKTCTQWFTIDASDMAKIEWDSYYYLAKDISKEKEVHLDTGERIESKWVSFDELLEIADQFGNRNKGIKEKLQEARQNEEEKQKLKTLLGITE